MKIACVSISRSDWNALGMVAMALREQGADVAVITDRDHDEPDMIDDDGPWSHSFALNDAELVVLLGDRYRTAVHALQIAHDGQAIAHVAGGDITEGSADDSYRHAITKLAHLHFPTHQAAAERIRQMGEEPWRVLEHGSASIDRIKSTKLLSREDTWRTIGVRFDPSYRDGTDDVESRVAVFNWQPETLGDPMPSADGYTAFQNALTTAMDGSVHLVAIGPNDDPGGEEIRRALRSQADYAPMRCTFAQHLAPQVYLSLLAHCACLYGNSSSAYYEAAYLGCPAVDIGDRQLGRPQCANIRRPRDGTMLSIMQASIAIKRGEREIGKTPFGNGNAAPAIAKAILSFDGQRDRLLRKKFVSASEPDPPNENAVTVSVEEYRSLISSEGIIR